MAIGSNAFAGWNPFAGGAGYAGGYGEGAGGFSWASLLQNKAFLSLLSQIGAGIAGDNPAVQGINQLNQQMIGAKSMADLMQKYLAGQVPGGKFQVDDKGFKLSGPTSELGDLSQPGAINQSVQKGLSQGPFSTATPQGNQMGQINPFISSQPGALSYADLAGLTPQDVLQAMQVASNAIYQSNISQTQRTQADTQRMAEWRRIKEIPNEVPVKVGNQTLYVDPKDALNYYAKVNNLPTSYETYKLAVDDPEFKDYLVEMAKAGKTEINIGETVAKTKAVGKAKQELDVISPTWRNKFISDIKEDRYNYRKETQKVTDKVIKSYPNISPEQARSQAEKFYIMDKYYNELVSQYGKDRVDAEFIDGVVIWTIDGEEVARY